VDWSYSEKKLPPYDAIERRMMEGKMSGKKKNTAP
jgi:hypothetical protein